MRLSTPSLHDMRLSMVRLPRISMSQGGFHHDLTGGALTSTPISGALSLFTMSLGALGLLGWWRKKKLASAV